jgi:hypothetical protein
MPRYSTARAAAKRTAWDIDEDEPFRPHLEVDGHEAVDTGLVWESGEPIMRLPNPIGFGRDDEW